MNRFELVPVWEKDFVTIHHSDKYKLAWNEWRGSASSKSLREAMVYASEYVRANDVEYILADFTRMTPPSMDDQVWIANNTAEILRDSKLKKVANVLGADLFQQVAIESIYAVASKVPMPCESKSFLTKEEALEWLLE